MSSRSRQFEPALLLPFFEHLPHAPAYWVGLSGGADSTALLIALSELRTRLQAPLHAIHFNHRLQEGADQWEQHSRALCLQLGVPLRVEKFDLPSRPGCSRELLARNARYAAASAILVEGDLYLTAHHADDQAETVFLNLMRGSGIDGLAAIPGLRRLGAGWVARPLLEITRAEIREFLRSRGARWCEDPSNQDKRIDRNYLRHEVFPALEARWPGLVERLLRTSRHARALSQALAPLLTGHRAGFAADSHRLPVEPLLGMHTELQALMIRQWIRDRDIIMPPGSKLSEFLRQLGQAPKRRSQAEICWDEWQIKRHGEWLWLHEAQYPAACPAVAWSRGNEIQISEAFGSLLLAGESADPHPVWHVGPRRPGARMRIAPGGSPQSLKELLGKAGIPPWLRDAIPFLYLGDAVVAIGDWQLDPQFRQWLAQQALEYRWHPRHPLLLRLRSLCHERARDVAIDPLPGLG